MSSVPHSVASVPLCEIHLRSYLFFRAHASFRATKLWCESITKRISLADGGKEVFYTQTKGVGYLV